MLHSLLIPEVDLIFELVGRRNVGDDLGDSALVALILAFLEDAPGKRVGEHGLGLVGVGEHGDLAHTSCGYIFLELCVAHFLLYRSVIDIEHSEKEQDYYGIGPVHTEPDLKLLRVRIIVEWSRRTHFGIN